MRLRIVNSRIRPRCSLGDQRHFDASEFEDRYKNAVVEMLKPKQAGLPPAGARGAAPTNVVNLMEAEKPSAGRAKLPKGRNGKESERRPAKGARRDGPHTERSAESVA